MFLKCNIFYVVCQKISQSPEKNRTIQTGVATPRLKTAGLKAFEQLLSVKLLQLKLWSSLLTWLYLQSSFIPLFLFQLRLLNIVNRGLNYLGQQEFCKF